MLLDIGLATGGLLGGEAWSTASSVPKTEHHWFCVAISSSATTAKAISKLSVSSSVLTTRKICRCLKQTNTKAKPLSSTVSSDGTSLWSLAGSIPYRQSPLLLGSSLQLLRTRFSISHGRFSITLSLSGRGNSPLSLKILPAVLPLGWFRRRTIRTV